MSNELTRYDQIKNVFRSEEIMKRFAEVVGGWSAGAYISSVLMAVANSDSLQKCETKSILYSALRAATLHLSVDPSTKQAYMVPFKGRATLVIGYKGYYDMALRTHQYRFIQVGDVYEGMVVDEDIMTGFHSIHGQRTGETVIGHILVFELKDGFRKTFYMTVEQIHDHASRYSKSYGMNDSPWKTHAYDMQRKTVLRLGLSKWGVFDPHDLVTITSEEIEPEEDAIEIKALEEKTAPKITEEQALSDLGYENTPPQARVVPQEARSEAQTAQVDENAVEVPGMAYETAKDFKTKEGQLYIDIETATLSHMANSLNKGIGGNKYQNGHLEEAQQKLAAIRVILQKRSEANVSVK